MNKFGYLRFLHLALPLMLILPITSYGQSRANIREVDQRLQRVERVLDQSLLELLQEIEALKREIRRLRGEMESQTYEFENLKKTNRDLYLDGDQRLGELETRLEQVLQGGLPSLADEPGLDLSDIDTTLGAEDDAPAVFVSPDAATNSSAGSSTEASGRSRAATAEEKLAYSEAYNLLASGDSIAAIANFQQFIVDYPNGPYTDNAWYWQGEARYAQRDFEAAISNFEEILNRFPLSPKVPDARLKVGFALFEQTKYTQAREILTSVQTDYPGRSAAVLATKRLKEMDQRGL